LYPDGKNCAVPVLHRDYFVAKDEAQWPALRQVTPTNFIAGPLGLRRRHLDHDSLHASKSLADAKHMLFCPILNYK